ncbi:hypothetical protein Tco_1551836 [Tanacetum coccineum]
MHVAYHAKKFQQRSVHYKVLLFKWSIIYDSVTARIVTAAEKEAGTAPTATKQEARNTTTEQLTTAS